MLIAEQMTPAAVELALDVRQHTLLRSFVTFAERHGDRHIEVTRVLEWATLAPSPQQRRNRLVTVRRFALVLVPRHRDYDSLTG
ncbi:hypothetical protein ACOJBM_01820 [Rhizobium beringeri]